MMAGRTNYAESIRYVATTNGVDRVQHPAGRPYRDIPGVGRDIGIAGAQVRAAGLHVLLGDLQVTRIVAENEFVDGGIPGGNTFQPIEEAAALKRSHDRVVARGALRMIPPGQMIAVSVVRH